MNIWRWKEVRVPSEVCSLGGWGNPGRGEERRKGALFWLLSCKCLGDTKHKVGERTERKVAEASGRTWSLRERGRGEEPAARAQPWRALVFKSWLGRRSKRNGREGEGPERGAV